MDESNERIWYQMIAQGVQSMQCVLHPDIEKTTMLLLKKYLQRPELFGRAMAMQWLQLHTMDQDRDLPWLECADVIVLSVGLFPQHCRRRGVPLFHYVQMSHGIYQQLSHASWSATASVTCLAESLIHVLDLLWWLASRQNTVKVLANEELAYFIRYHGSYFAQWQLEQDQHL